MGAVGIFAFQLYNHMSPTIFLAAIAILLALIFNFTNGFNDSANQVATVISSRALAPMNALVLAALGNFVGAFFLGTAVAQTLGKGIVDPTLLHTGNSGVFVVMAALIGATLWNTLTWYFGIPSSSSHALLGGLIGAFVMGWGFTPIHWPKVYSILVVMVVSPLVGFALTFVLTRVVMDFSRRLHPKAGRVFDRLQVLTLMTQALSHGTNDAQQSMGVITFVLILLGLHAAPVKGPLLIPVWVIIACSLAIAIGTMIGGWRVIKTLGVGLYKVTTVHAFMSQAASSLIIYVTALLGYPISTTQVISSSVIGAGAATRFNMIRWGVVRDMAIAWLITIPSSALMAGISFYLIKHLLLHENL
jgi:PiT family inorganic phosphate transporter